MNFRDDTTRTRLVPSFNTNAAAKKVDASTLRAVLGLFFSQDGDADGFAAGFAIEDIAQDPAVFFAGTLVGVSLPLSPGMTEEAQTRTENAVEFLKTVGGITIRDQPSQWDLGVSARPKLTSAKITVFPVVFEEGGRLHLAESLYDREVYLQLLDLHRTMLETNAKQPGAEKKRQEMGAEPAASPVDRSEPTRKSSGDM